MERAFAYSILALLTALVFWPGRYKRHPDVRTVWNDLEGFTSQGLSWIATFMHARALIYEKESDHARCERIFAIRMGLAGLLLLAVFPLHRVFFTDAFIDFIWAVVDAVSSVVSSTRLASLVHVESDWRYQEYYLWEVAAFLWTLIQFCSSHLREIGHLLDDQLIRPRTAFWAGIIYVVTGFLIAMAGLIILVLAVSLYVLLFQTIVVALLLSLEILIARTYFGGARPELAMRGYESAAFIELPALIAFCLSAIFVASAEGFSGYSSHWSHSFASGAAALDLVLANVGLLAIRIFNLPRAQTA